MPDWATIAGLATAFGTLVLALATFAALRSSNRAARTAERALLFGMQPLLFASRLQDPTQTITWVDQHLTVVDGGHGAAELTENVIYLAISVRNAGSGVAVLQGWHAWTEMRRAMEGPAPTHQFRRLTRDLYIAPQDIGFWQGAFRDPSEPEFHDMAPVIRERRRFAIDLLYTNAEGGQRTISRFSMSPTEDGRWLSSVARHWNLDMRSPR
ncbi:MAG: hypothetical protein JOY80_03635 [Candidatus Dormibacteraeota bacterium]|nr:hypothetical protein [Candidatus Dormibacteraeota bacterium]